MMKKTGLTNSISKVVITTMLLVFSGLCLTACDKSSGSNVTREDFVGEWIVEDDYDTQYLTLLEDGTYLSNIHAAMGFTYESENKWYFEDGVYTVDYVDLGVKSVYNKVTLDGDTMILDNGTGKIYYKRNNH